jgi:hypothetical protein
MESQETSHGEATCTSRGEVLWAISDSLTRGFVAVAGAGNNRSPRRDAIRSSFWSRRAVDATIVSVSAQRTYVRRLCLLL